MTTKNDCCGGGKITVVLACSGSSNVGQMTNEAAKRLDVNGDAKYFCLAGVGGQVSGMVASVKGADKVLVLDGCPVGCGKKCADQAGLSEYHHLVVTELGIEKKHSFELPEADVAKTVEASRQLIGTSLRGKSCRCCG
jgi:uncharacterized metal-binding protein